MDDRVGDISRDLMRSAAGTASAGTIDIGHDDNNANDAVAGSEYGYELTAGYDRLVGAR
jgi:hypothetical protein